MKTKQGNTPIYAELGDIQKKTERDVVGSIELENLMQDDLGPSAGSIVAAGTTIVQILSCLLVDQTRNMRTFGEWALDVLQQHLLFAIA